MKPARSLVWTVAALAVLVTGTPGILAAGIDIDFGANVRVNDRTDLFFSISSRYFDRDRAVVDSWGARYSDPDDLSVFLFLSRHSGQSPDAIYQLRRRGLSWWEIGVRIGVPADVWFVPVRRAPGPPYGKAYGHWKKHRSNPHASIVLTDVDARHLVAVRMIHEYYGVPVETAMQWRSGGRSVRDLMADEYGKRHGKPAKATAKPAGKGPSKGKGKGKGRGRGKH